MSVVSIEFVEPYWTRKGSYMPGDKAAFSEDEAKHIVASGRGRVLRVKAMTAPPVDKMVKRAPKKKRHEKPAWNAPQAP